MMFSDPFAQLQAVTDATEKMRFVEVVTDAALADSESLGSQLRDLATDIESALNGVTKAMEATA